MRALHLVRARQIVPALLLGWTSIAGLSIQKMLFEGVSMTLEGQGADVRSHGQFWTGVIPP